MQTKKKVTTHHNSLCSGWKCLQVFDQLLLLLEDVLEFSKSGLHLLQRELVLTLRRLVLGDPGVELGDGVVKEGPLLDEGVDLLDALVVLGDVEAVGASAPLFLEC